MDHIELHPGFGNQSEVFPVCPAVRLMTSLSWTNELSGYLTTKSRLVEIYERSKCKWVNCLTCITLHVKLDAVARRFLDIVLFTMINLSQFKDNLPELDFPVPLEQFSTQLYACSPLRSSARRLLSCIPVTINILDVYGVLLFIRPKRHCCQRDPNLINS